MTVDGRILLFSLIEVTTELVEEEVDFCDNRELQDGVEKLTGRVLVEILADFLIFEDFDLYSSYYQLLKN